MSCAHGTTEAQGISDRLPGTSNTVSHFARVGHTLYAAGGFSLVGANTGGGVIVDRVSGALVGSSKVAGIVYACIADGRGGWFIGGEFTGVGGKPRRNVAHVLRDGRIADWRADTDGRVNALAQNGARLYIGGEFTQVGGAPHPYLAAVDTVAGHAYAWDARVGGIGQYYTSVNCILVDEGTAYIGGDFSFVGDSTRLNVAAIDIATSSATAFAPDADSYVNALALSASTLYIGGGFKVLAGAERYRLGEVDRTSGVLTAFDPRIDAASYDYDLPPYVSALALDDTLLYVAGHFTRIGLDVRGGLGAIGRTGAKANAWDPHPIAEDEEWRAPFIHALAIRDNVAFIGGLSLDSLGGRPALNVGAVSTLTALAVDWQARASDAVFAVGVSADRVYIGGEFTLFGDFEVRYGLAAFDLRTGALLPWQPVCSGWVGSLAADSSAVYIGGRFTSVNGQPRQNLAAIDPVSGETLPWNPGVNDAVLALSVHEGRVLIGGHFTTLGEQLRAHLGAVRTSDGTVDDWSPSVDDAVSEIVPDGDVIYLAGYFTSVGGVSRRYCAAVDFGTGAVSPWDPAPDQLTESIAVGPDVVYLGGAFESVGGASRSRIAAVDKATGAATAWDPDVRRPETGPSARVYSLLVSENAIYAGGDIGEIGGAERQYLAALDPATGHARAWDPGIGGGAVWSLARLGDELYVGGSFDCMGVLPVSGIGACSIARPPLPPPATLALGPSFPNPASSSAGVAFALPAAARVSLDIFDVLGRRVAAVLNGEQRPAGWNEVSFDVHDWQPGCYLYRLQAGSQVAAGKLLVVR